MARKHVNLGSAPDKRDLPQKTCVVCGKPFSCARDVSVYYTTIAG